MVRKIIAIIESKKSQFRQLRREPKDHRPRLTAYSPAHKLEHNRRVSTAQHGLLNPGKWLAKVPYPDLLIAFEDL